MNEEGQRNRIISMMLPYQQKYMNLDKFLGSVSGEKKQCH